MPNTIAAEDEWRRCADWLMRCLTDYPDILQQASSVLDTPTANLLDFLNCLKDGVLLCHILPALSRNQIQLESLPGFKLATLNSPFAFRQNLAAFLDQCRDHFGLPKAELFSPDDLLNQENVAKLIRCLALLSVSQRARQSGIAGFEIGAAGASSDTSEYSSLLTTATAAAAAGTLAVPEHRQYGEIAAERVYETIMNRTQGPSVMADAEIAHATPKEMCVREIVTTERAYVDTLKLLVEDVMRPLKDPNSSWSPVEVDAIFEYLPELLTLHRKLLRELEVATQLRGSKSLPVVLVEQRGGLLIYGNYCAHMPAAIKLLEDACRLDKKRTDELQKALDAAKGQFKLTEYLTVPMQRVLRYHLLLTSLIKFDEKLGGLEQVPLQAALEAMKDVAAYVNEVKRDTEMRALIDQIQGQITNLDLPGNLRLVDYGRFEIDDDLRLANDPMKPLSGSKPCTCFLWTRMFMLTKARPSLTFKSAYAVKPNLIVRELMDGGSGGSGGGGGVPGDSKWTWPFVVSEPGKEQPQQQQQQQQQLLQQQPEKGKMFFVFLAKSRDARQRWLDAFQRAMDDVAPANFNAFGHHFERRTLDNPAYCSVCTKLIHGCFFQGYSCRKTGLIVHKQCIPNKPFVAPSPQQQPLINQSSARLSTARPQSLMSQNSYTGPRTMTRGHPPPVSRRDTISYVSPLITPTNVVDGGGGGGGGGGFSVAAASPRASPSPQPMARISQQTAELDIETLSQQQQAAAAPLSSPRVSVSTPLPAWPDYYAGVMGREEARDTLMQRPPGTFLVRESQGADGYAISLRHGDTVKHMRVQRSPEGYKLGEVKYFPTVQELVIYYCTNSLRECFLELDCYLKVPFKSRSLTSRKSSGVLGWVSVVRDYDAPPSSGHVSLRAGEIVAVLGQDGVVWSGKKLNGQVGQFPSDVVGALSASPIEG